MAPTRIRQNGETNLTQITSGNAKGIHSAILNSCRARLILFFVARIKLPAVLGSFNFAIIFSLFTLCTLATMLDLLVGSEPSPLAHLNRLFPESIDTPGSRVDDNH